MAPKRSPPVLEINCLNLQKKLRYCKQKLQFEFDQKNTFFN